jgi:hypothetical protein
VAAAFSAAVVGAVAFLVSLRADRRAEAGVARAVRAEARAEEADRRDREAYAWDKKRHEEEQAAARAEAQVRAWVVAKKAKDGGAPFAIPAAEVEMAREAARLGLLEVRESRRGDGSIDMVAWVP